MATFLRTWSYRYPWLYDAIARLSALAVGGEARFRQLPLEGLALTPGSEILDLCCGGGQATRFLIQKSDRVTGLDVSPVALALAARRVPEATYVEGLAEELPFAAAYFDVVHTSAALHEMAPDQLRQILQEVYRVLKPGGTLTLVDLHWPTNPLFAPGLALFLWLFETETAWQLVRTDLTQLLEAAGFCQCDRRLYAGGSLQVIQVRK